MKGIILAGGSGTRLHPLTLVASKQLLPVYDKPLIYYPLTTLMMAGIRDILIITTPEDRGSFEHLLGNGTRWGINIKYTVQPRPEGLAQAYILAEEFVGGLPSALILGDNLYFGHGLRTRLISASLRCEGATVFGYRVKDPERYGVIDFSDDGKVISIEEKPSRPKSNYAVTGLYFYDGRASQLVRQIKPSYRGELEITDLNHLYLEEGKLTVEILGSGYAWLDTGTHEALMQAGEFVRVIEQRQGQKIGCPEEIAYRMGFIDVTQLLSLATLLDKSGYGSYLRTVAESASSSFSLD